jgi:hypothetical protein
MGRDEARAVHAMRPSANSAKYSGSRVGRDRTVMTRAMRASSWRSLSSCKTRNSRIPPNPWRGLSRADVRIPRNAGGWKKSGGSSDSARGSGIGFSGEDMEHVSRGRGETGNARRTRGAW